MTGIDSKIPILLGQRIDEWRSSLIDLTKRNRLLYYRKTKGSTLEFSEQDSDWIYSNLAEDNGVLKFFLSTSVETAESNEDEKKMLDLAEEEKISPKEDELVSTETDPTLMKRILTNLYRKSREDYQERGVHILHLAFGMLTWVDPQANNAEIFRSPLLLCPVILERENANKPFVLTLAEEDLILNPALQTKLKRDYNIDLPNLAEEETEQPISTYLSKVREWLTNDEWGVDEKTVLGLFSFEKLGMYQDLGKNADHLAKNPVILRLAGVDKSYSDPAEHTTGFDLDEYQKPEETFQILDADSSQQQCIQAVLQGENLVLQGPPGTGKSQTIANIIAEFLARNKTVLFVSEKMAALEVVYKRLEDKQLGNYCLELHSHKANKKKVLEALNEAAEHSLKPLILPSKDDYHKLKVLSSQLNEYVKALHEHRSELGCSVHEVISKVSENIKAPLLTIGVEPERLTPKNYQTWEKEIKALGLVWSVALEGDEFPWSGAKDQYFGPEVRDKWRKRLSSLQGSLLSLWSGANAYSQKTGLPLAITLEDVDWLIEVAELIDKGVVPASIWLTTDEMNDILEEAKKYNELTKQYWQLKQQLEQVVNSEFFSVEDDVKAKLEDLWDRTKDLFPILDTDGIVFKAQYRELSNFVNILPREIEEIRQYAISLSEVTGANLPINKLAEIFKLTEIVSYSYVDVKPEKTWLTQKGWKETSDLVKATKPIYMEYNRRRADLLLRYEESIFDIDAESLLERLNSWSYRGVFKFVNPDYYQAKKEIIRCTKAFCMPENIVEDLLSIRAVQILKGKISSKHDEVCHALGSYYRETATNFEEVVKGLSVAEILIGLNDNIEYSDSLAEYLSTAASLPIQYKKTIKILMQKYKEWVKRENELRDCISVDNFQGNGIALQQCSLSDLYAWSESHNKVLIDIAGQIDKLLECYLQAPLCVSDLLRDLEKLSQLRNMQAAVKVESDGLKRNFGHRFNGVTTEWEEVLAAIEWTLQLRGLLANEKMSPEVIQYLTNLERSPENEGTQLKKLLVYFKTPFIEEFKASFVPGHPMINGETNLKQIELRELLAFFRILENRIDELDNWVEYNQRKKGLLAQGLGSFINQAEQEVKDAGELLGAYSRGFYQALVNNVFSKEPRLMKFRGKSHYQVIEEFKKLDKKLIAQAPLAIMDICNRKKPTNNGSISSSSAEINILKSEAVKKRRHMPLLKLFQKIPNLLVRLKPCLMMSPLSVSQYIEPDSFSFDLVIFDEASQIFTEDAVIAIYRGKQVVIAGDSKQMPPTNFFQASEIGDAEYDVDEDEEPVTSSADFSSVLDECTPIFPTSMLRWHYRSRHESLIAFSNQQFYGNKLITFPSSVKKSEDFGVHFEFVEKGIYERGGRKINPIEAQRVAEIVVNNFKQFPHKSIGVVAFSQSQMMAIQDVLDNMRQKDPSLEVFFKEDRLNGFFCKNLENVQGDERDIIIFSVGYGKDAQGRLSMNFGPLNKEGGERRLNVAITRAREKVILISSISAGDINPLATKSAGVLNLYKYLRFAEQGEQALELTRPEGREDTDSPLEDDVIQVIRQMGYTPIPQVGCSGYRIDIGIVHPNQPGTFVLGVECDGRTYHSAPTARDRDRLRQQVLEGLGWKIYRIWSPDWFQRRESEIEKLKQTIQMAVDEETQIKNSNPVEPVPIPLPIITVPTEIIGEENLLPGVVPYQVYTVGSHPAWGDFNQDGSLSWHVSNIRKIVKQEGPIHIDVVAKRLADAWSLSRIGARMKRTVEAACQKAAKQDTILICENGFLWPKPCTKAAQVRVPIKGDINTVRKIEYIADEEICGAMVLILKQAIGMPRENLAQETTRIFGFQRSKSQINERLEECIDYCLKRGSIAVTGETLTSVNKTHICKKSKSSR